MTIILPFSGGVTAYLSIILDWYRTTPYFCPLCKGKTHRHGKYLRTVYSQDECFIIPIFRRRCPNCRVTFSFIPSFIKPYARFLNSYRFALFQRHVVDGISIRQTPSYSSAHGMHSVSTCTFRRWLKRFKKIAPEVSKHLTTRLLELRPGLSIPKGLPDIAFVLNAGQVLNLIVQSLLPEEPLHSYGVFDMLNLLLPGNLLV
ncbi:hypothetical protein Tfer_0960 [Thermincola ferriacetica]|uniref:DUF6431 domain-containing protein n=1 Tax=Thermincola ferriacetica TaxID=281456 RepID=A0A0L6W4J7_9FIRM|nr:DUF6431 domain-containing protein [Thermincola ferriacetica]KNZ70396.1 hypothetical protein Tfer_0960 [Thermincola ferriacetica]